MESVFPLQTPWGVTGTLGQHSDRTDLCPSITAKDRLARAHLQPRGSRGTTALTSFCKATDRVVIMVPPEPALCLQIRALALPAQAGDLSTPCTVFSSVQWGQYQQRTLSADVWTELDELTYARCLEQCPACSRDTHGSFGDCFSIVSSEMWATMNLSKGEQGRVKVCFKRAGATV